MTFNSLSYFLFLPLVYLIFYVTPDRSRWLVLLVASYCFYATFKAPQLLLVLALVTIVSYACGIWLGRTTEEKERTRIFWLGAGSCVVILAVIKYLPAFLSPGAAKLTFVNLMISVGVSYFTFQAISYLTDIYLEIQEPEQHLGYHALYFAFFPKLLQGPIERAGDLLPQLKTPYVFNYTATRSGMLLFAWGLFKKVVVADRLALYANQVFSDVHAYNGLPLIIATYAYALQIYFDFSGYTDMARGTARIFGINLTENFNSPYLATSIADFWRRWHISFSRWILDYIFKPLQMSWRDWGQTGTAVALIITFLVSGIWHGASLGFVIWGLLHGIYLASSTYYRPYQKRLHKWLGVEKSRLLKIWQVFATFNLVSFAWIFFRADSLGDAWYVVKNSINLDYLTMIRTDGFQKFFKYNVLLGLGEKTLWPFLVSIMIFGIFYRYFENENKITNIYTRWVLYISLLLICMNLGVSIESKFIYLQF